MFEFLLFGSMVWFWLLFGLWSVVLFFSVEKDWPAQATIVTIGFFLLFGLFGKLPGGLELFALVAANPLYAALAVAAFFVLGTTWAVAKWWFYVHNLAEKRKAQIDRSAGNDIYHHIIRMPLVSNNKSRIVMWMCLWPYSFVWTIINDPVRMVFRAIYRQIKEFLQKIASKAFEGLEPGKNPDLDPNKFPNLDEE